MTHISHGGHADISRALERQMRNWELSRAQRLGPAPAGGGAEVADFIAISRTLASGGSQVAQRLGERLHWPVFDRELLQAMAGDDRVRARLYEQMDERDVSWLESTVRWLLRGEFRKDDYGHRLTETVLALARHQSAVFLGRGADLILPRQRGLRVRITASVTFRAEQFAVRNNIPAAMAVAEVERVDHERAEYRRKHFGAEANDVTRHDLVLVMDRLTPEQAVEVVLAAAHARGLTGGE